MADITPLRQYDSLDLALAERERMEKATGWPWRIERHHGIRSPAVWVPESFEVVRFVDCTPTYRPDALVGDNAGKARECAEALQRLGHRDVRWEKLADRWGPFADIYHVFIGGADGNSD